jgi:hypothetical protein
MDGNGLVSAINFYRVEEDDCSGNEEWKHSH